VQLCGKACACPSAYSAAVINFIDIKRIKTLLAALHNTLIALIHEPAGHPLLDFSMYIAIPVPSTPKIKILALTPE